MCGSGLRPPPHTPSLSLNINRNVRLGNFQMVLSEEISVDDDRRQAKDASGEAGVTAEQREISRRSAGLASVKMERGNLGKAKAYSANSQK